MARLNKVLCDKCGKELTTDYLKMMISQPTKNQHGYMIYPSMGRADLCRDCFKEFKTNFLGGKE